MKVEIYSRNDCIWCERAKSMLNINKIPFTEHKLNVDFSREELLEIFPSAKTFPVIVVNDKFIGGYEDMAKLMEEQKENFGKDLLKE